MSARDSNSFCGRLEECRKVWGEWIKTGGPSSSTCHAGLQACPPVCPHRTAHVYSLIFKHMTRLCCKSFVQEYGALLKTCRSELARHYKLTPASECSAIRAFVAMMPFRSVIPKIHMCRSHFCGYSVSMTLWA